MINPQFQTICFKFAKTVDDSVCKIEKPETNDLFWSQAYIVCMYIYKIKIITQFQVRTK